MKQPCQWRTFIFSRTRQYKTYAGDLLILGRWVRAIEERVTQINLLAPELFF